MCIYIHILLFLGCRLFEQLMVCGWRAPVMPRGTAFLTGRHELFAIPCFDLLQIVSPTYLCSCIYMYLYLPVYVPVFGEIYIFFLFIWLMNARCRMKRPNIGSFARVESAHVLSANQ